LGTAKARTLRRRPGTQKGRRRRWVPRVSGVSESRRCQQEQIPVCPSNDGTTARSLIVPKVAIANTGSFYPSSQKSWKYASSEKRPFFRTLDDDIFSLKNRLLTVRNTRFEKQSSIYSRQMSKLNSLCFVRTGFNGIPTRARHFSLVSPAAAHHFSYSQ
jgi:hypothetical protein